MRTMLLIISFILGLLPNLSAQATWVKKHISVGSNTSHINAVRLIQGGGYVVAGSFTPFGSSDLQVWAAELTVAGDIVWQHTYGTIVNSETGWSLASSNDGGFLIAVEGQDHGTIMKISGAGDLLWANKLDQPGIFFQFVDESWDGGTTTIGYSAVPGDGSRILHLDSGGTPIWQRIFNNGGVFALESVRDLSSQAGFIAVGHSQLGLLAMEVDNLGNIVWQKEYTHAPFNVLGRDVDEAADGFVISTIEVNGPDAYLGLMKIDFLGNVLWHKTYMPVNAGNDEPVVADSTSYTVAAMLPCCSTTQAVMVNVDPATGNILWQHTYNDIISEQTGLEVTTDGGYFLATGSSQGMILYRLNSAGETDLGCSLITPATASALDQSSTVGNPNVTAQNTNYVAIADSFIQGDLSTSPQQLCPTGCANSISLSPSTLPSAVQDSSYSATFTADGGNAPYGYSGSGIPLGLFLDGATGVLSGVPQVAGAYSMSITALDSSGCAGSANYTLTVLDPQSLLLNNDFSDGSVTWDIKKGNWQESNGAFVGVGAATAIAFAPVPWAPSGLSECSLCTFETDIQTAGGPFGKIFVEVWFQDGANKVDLLMKEPGDKWVLKQKKDGAVVRSAKAAMKINPGVSYNVRITFDGTNFHAMINGTEIITMPAVGSPSGSAALKVKNTTGTFSSFRVY